MRCFHLERRTWPDSKLAVTSRRGGNGNYIVEFKGRGAAPLENVSTRKQKVLGEGHT